MSEWNSLGEWSPGASMAPVTRSAPGLRSQSVVVLSISRAESELMTTVTVENCEGKNGGG